MSANVDAVSKLPLTVRCVGYVTFQSLAQISVGPAEGLLAQSVLARLGQAASPEDALCALAL